MHKEAINRLLHNPFYLHTDRDHTMSSFLLKYLDIKMHQLIDSDSYDRITVIGLHDRSSTTISSKEKPGKRYNWQRPTAHLDGRNLIICCYPGRDYVRHYASLIGTYLALTGRNPKIVKYVYPTEAESWNSIQSINLSEVGHKNIVIVGYGLDSIFSDSSWTENDAFWHSQYVINGHHATLLLIKHSFWGDIAGYVARKLAETGFQRIVFVGKLGSLRPGDKPNECLATGTSSLVEGELVQWKSLFSSPMPDYVKTGTHICVPSVIYETRPWASLAVKGFDFVDPEIGHMARETIRMGAEFSYLHLVSDNVYQQGTENLSNERGHAILNKRVYMKKRICEFLLSSLMF